MATVHIHRSRRWRDGLYAYQVVIDGVEVGRVKRGESVSYHVEGGQHEIYAKSIVRARSQPVTFALADDAEIYLRAEANISRWQMFPGYYPLARVWLRLVPAAPRGSKHGKHDP